MGTCLRGQFKNVAKEVLLTVFAAEEFRGEGLLGLSGVQIALREIRASAVLHLKGKPSLAAVFHCAWDRMQVCTRLSFRDG